MRGRLSLTGLMLRKLLSPRALSIAVRWRLISRARRLLWMLRRGRVVLVRLVRRLLWMLRRGRVVLVRLIFRLVGRAYTELASTSAPEKERSRPRDFPSWRPSSLEINDSLRATQYPGGSGRNYRIHVNEICEALGYQAITNRRDLQRYQRQLRSVVQKNSKRVSYRVYPDKIAWKDRRNLTKAWVVEDRPKLSSGEDFFLAVAAAMLGKSREGSLGSGSPLSSRVAQTWSAFLEDLDPDFKPRISILLATRRSEKVASAIEQISSQKNCRIEVILLAHGFTPGEQVNAQFENLLASKGHSLKSITIDESKNLSGVLNIGVNNASNELLLKWDDDDFYGARHVIGLLVALTVLGVEFIGRPANLVEISDHERILRRHAGPEFIESISIAGGTILTTKSAIKSSGGWGHLPSGVDQDLLKRARRRGFRVWSADDGNFILAREKSGHTWGVDHDYFYRSATSYCSSAYRHLVLSLNLKDNSKSLLEESSLSGLSVCIPFRNDHFAYGLQIRRYTNLDASLKDDLNLRSVVLVDDRSSVPLQTVQLGPPFVETQIRDGVGFGAGAARNRAETLSDGDTVIFHDSDVMVSDDALRNVYKLLQTFDVVHARIGFAQETAEMSTFPECFELPYEMSQEWREQHFYESLDLGIFTSTSYRMSVGGFLGVRRSVHSEIGGFRDIRTRGVEDTEYGYRLSQSGARQAVYSRPGIVHLGPRTFEKKDVAQENNRTELLHSLIPNFSPTSIFSDTKSSGSNPYFYFPKSTLQLLSIEDLEKSRLSFSINFDSFLDAPYALLFLSEMCSFETKDWMRVSEKFSRPSSGVLTLIAEGRRVGIVVSLGALNYHLRCKGEKIVRSAFDLENDFQKFTNTVWGDISEVKSDILYLETA